MAIEFRCTKCGKLLRTGDDTAGKHAKCPECGEILVIPARRHLYAHSCSRRRRISPAPAQQPSRRQSL